MWDNHNAEAWFMLQFCVGCACEPSLLLPSQSQESKDVDGPHCKEYLRFMVALIHNHVWDDKHMRGRE
jgi:hypothetical protein